MHKFSDFNIAPEVSSFTGDKIKIGRILNVEITVLGFKIKESTQKSGTKYLTLQIEKQGSQNIVFTGSKILMTQIQKIDKDNFPFTTTIVKDNEYYEFT